MFFIKGLAIILLFQTFTISKCFSTPRCPPLADLKDVNCKCENSKKSHILECNGGDLPKLHNVYVDEIIITKSLSDKIEFDFIKGPKIITLQENHKFQVINIKALLTKDVESIKLINNTELNGGENINKILQQITNAKSIHIENSGIDNLNLPFKDFKELNYILLPSNGIKNIEGNLFEELPKLKILDLSHNKIKTLKASSLTFGSNQDVEIFLNNNEINFDNLISSNLKDNFIGENKMTVHLENNKIEKINNSFVDFVTNKIKIYFDGNDINCDTYPKIKDVLENEDSRNFLLNIYCKNYGNNLFEISKFTDQPATATTPEKPLSTLPIDHIKTGHLTLKITKGKFSKKNSSYVAVCINEGAYDTLDTKNCKLCGSSNTPTEEHTYDGACQLLDKKYSEETLLVFGAARVQDSTLRPENVDGLAMITIKDALYKAGGTGKAFKLEFDEHGNQFIEVLINFN